MSIGLVDAIAGGGKTTAIMQQAVALAVEQKQRVCISLPTKEVIDEKYSEALKLADGRINVHRVHGNVAGCQSVGAKLEELLTDIGSRKPAVLFTTHKTFNDCPNWIGRHNWKFYVDELFDPVDHVMLRLPHNYSILTSMLELVSPDDEFSEVQVASSKRRAFNQMRDGTDDVDSVFERIAARLAQPERWKVYVETENFRAVESGIGTSRLVDQRELAATLHFWAVQLPWFDREKLDVTMASACFTDRLIYKLWERNGTEFLPDRDVMSQLLCTAHIGTGVELHCMNIENWSTWVKNGHSRTATSLNTPQRAIEKLAVDLFRDEPFFFNANSDWNGACFGPNALQVNVVEHGKNAFSHFRNVAFMPSLLPVPNKWRFLRWSGFTDADIRDEYYHSHAYQTVFRSAARQQVRDGTVKALLPGRAACEYIKRKAPGADIIEHEVLAPSRGRGRPIKYANAAEARAAHARRMREKRQATKLRIGA